MKQELVNEELDIYKIEGSGIGKRELVWRRKKQAIMIMLAVAIATQSAVGD